MNLLRQMVAGRGASAVDGNVRLTDAPLILPSEIGVPFRADFIAQTNSTNIRLGFAQGQVIFNWELNPSELRFRDLVDGSKISAFANKGAVPVNQWVKLSWIIEADSSKILVDGEERAAINGDYRNLFSAVSISPALGSVVMVKSVSITPLPITLRKHD